MEKFEIRRLLLEVLYELGTGLHKHDKILAKMAEKSGMPQEFFCGKYLQNSLLLEAIEYLNDKKLIVYEPQYAANLQGPFAFKARIHANGKDIVNNKEKLDKEIPPTQQIINVQAGGTVWGITNTGDVNIEQIFNNIPDDVKNELADVQKTLKEKPKVKYWIEKIMIAAVPPATQLLLKKLFGL